MRALLLWMLFVIAATAGVWNDWYRYRGEQAAIHHQWSKALRVYEQITHPDEMTRYTLGNLYYRLGRYRQAIVQYTSLHDSKLEYRRLHNLGNCAMHLGDLARAVALYEAAMVLHPSERTRHNLLLAQTLLRQKQKMGAACTTNILPHRRSAKEGKANFDDNTTSNEGKWNESNRSIVRSDNLVDPHAYRGSGSAEISTFPQKQTVIEITQSPEGLSAREEAKWDRTLANRPVKTLLIPLDFPSRSHP